MKRKKVGLTAFVAMVVLAVAFSLAACSSGTVDLGSDSGQNSSQNSSAPYVISVEQTASDESGSSFTVYYSDGTSTTFTVAAGKDGQDGEDGQDGADLTVEEVFERYKKETGDTDMTYAEFLEKYLTFTTDDSASIAKSLTSSVKLYTEFLETSSTGGFYPGARTSLDLYTGSGVVYDIDEEEGYTYMVTNYHVVFSSAAASANATNNANGQYIARKIVCYLYGSEYTPVQTTTDADGDGYKDYYYSDYGVECEYVGGSITSDIAIVRAKTEDLYAINDGISEVTLADGYTVGETAIAVGNPEGEGISVTKGIVSVDNEYITLDIDGTSRSYRSIRIDAALYSGNSGGGLFNAEGELIGINNAGDGEDQNINYAIPLEIVRGTADNILYYYRDGDADTAGAYKITLGVTVLSSEAKYVYDAASGTGRITETITVDEVSASSIAEAMGLQTGDVLTAFSIDGTEYALERNFDISDLILTLRPGSEIAMRYTRDGGTQLSEVYTVKASDLVSI